MRRRARIVFNLCLPAPLACVAMLAAYRFVPPLTEGLAMMLVAYAYAAVPSLIHSAVMEVFYAHGFPPARPSTIGLSAASGTMAGALVLTIAWGIHPSPVFSTLWFYLPLGAAVGTLVALPIWVLSRSHDPLLNQARQP